MTQRGLLPFRVWQIYKRWSAFVKVGGSRGYVAAAGILAHYVGDACQPLHGSYLADGDPYRKPDGTKVSDPLPYKKNYATGVHSAYERNMVNVGLEISCHLPKKLKNNHGMSLVTGGRDAGYAMIELMRRTRKTIQPLKIVEFYAPYSPSVRTEVAEKLWKKSKSPTLEVLADGCRTLAMLWEARGRGKGDKIPRRASRSRPRRTSVSVTKNRASCRRSRSARSIPSSSVPSPEVRCQCRRAIGVPGKARRRRHIGNIPRRRNAARGVEGRRHRWRTFRLGTLGKLWHK